LLWLAQQPIRLQPLREWHLGGVTQDLIKRDERCALVSH
jgi:hypothetical protein